MTDLAISLEPSSDDVPNPAVARVEHDTVGRFTIVANGCCATEGMDLHHGNSLEEGPLVSGYPIAQWLAWNWWRLRWEPPMSKSAPHRSADSWAMSHMLSTIGAGYCWPDITITSDGFSTELDCRAWSDTTHATFRYLRERTEVVPTSAFDSAVDAFVTSVLELLPGRDQPDDSLQTLWAEILQERRDPAVMRFRRMEARIGADPDEREEREIEALLARAAQLGEAAFEELASDPFVQADENGRLLRERQIEETAQRFGFPGNPREAVTLHGASDSDAWGSEPAWKTGQSAAQALREQERLSLDPLTNQRLCDLAGVSEQTLDPDAVATRIVAFMLHQNQQSSRIVLRSRNLPGRRFELARLLGDRALVGDGSLSPATSTSSYRQKVQRAFAAELLCPWEAAEPMFHGVVSEDDAMDLANHFGVSPLLLLNRAADHGYRTY